MSEDILQGTIAPPPQRQAISLAEKARRLALARAAMRQRAAHSWRDPRVLWPLFERS